MSLRFPNRLSWHNLYRGILKGLKVYAFYLAVLSVFRLLFLFVLRSYMGTGTAAPDIELALWRGFRLSMQTAGCLALVSFVPGFLLRLVYPRWENRVVLGINAVLLALLSILYMASFPFYRQSDDLHRSQ